MKNRVKLFTIALILMACSFLAGSGPTKAHAHPAPCQGTTVCFWDTSTGAGARCVCYCNALDQTGGIVAYCPYD